jgi:hypothetical protein
MRPNAKQLAMRDPALAALMGAISGDDFGSEFGGEMGEYGSYGFEFGLEPGALLSSAASAGPGSILSRVASDTISSQAALAPPRSVQAIVQQAQTQEAHTEVRTRMLEPNKHSRVKVERYAFALNSTLTLGVASAIDTSGSPDTNIRPQRVTINAPSPGFVTVSEIKVANVSVSVGGTQDAFDYASAAVGASLDMPTLSPANKARVLGNYTGFVPPGFVGGASYLLAISFKGPASVIA